jgi:ABC-type sugar transport system substrate-binding protein
MRTALKSFVAAALAVASAAASAADAPIAIGYVTKSATNEGWVLINKGAEDAAREAQVKLIVAGPSTSGALEDQINAIKFVVSQGVKAIALAPVDSGGVIPIVRRVSASNIPVIAIDTAIDDNTPKSYVATDNLAAAAAQAEWVAGQIGDAHGADVVLVNGDLKQSTGRDRRRGFLDRMRQLKPNANIIEVNTSWNADQARSGVETALRAHSKVSIIANAWDDGTLASVAAIRTLGIGKGRIKVVGFDGAPNALDLMRSEWIQADVAQMLYRQGYEGIKTAIAAAKGESVPARINTGHQLVTRDNLESFIKENKLNEFMQ